MPGRYAQYGSTESVPESRDIDRVLLGVRELNPGEIPPGFAASARNMRWSRGEAEPRLGVTKLPWTNRVTSQSQHTQPFGQVYGASEFNEALGVSWLIVAADGKVYRCRQFTAAAELPLPPGVSISRDVSFTQTRNGLIMWRGTEPPLLMPRLEDGFTTVVQQPNLSDTTDKENPEDGLEPIPATDRGDWIGNRLFFPYTTETELDLVGISDYLNATRHKGPRAQTRINQGSSDRLLRVVQLVENIAVCFKEESIYVLGNVKYDLSTMTLDRLTDAYGLCSPKAVANTGKDLCFLVPKRGVCSVRLTEQNKLQGVDAPLSAMIQETIDRINWRVAKLKATAAYFANKLYMAVPLDDATHAGVNQVAGLSYGGGGTRVMNVEPGKTYRWVKGTNDTNLVNGVTTLTESQDFIASDYTVTLSGAANKTIGGELRRLRIDVNNAVLVYDFITQEWAGIDDGCSFCVRDWVTATYQGVTRQMFVAEDGFINCIEELYYDECAYWSLSATNAFSGLVPSTYWIDVPVEPGQSYRWTPGGDWTLLTNGAQTLTGQSDFVATSNTVRVENLFGAADPLQGQLQAHVWMPVIEYVDHDWLSRGYGGDTISRKKWTDMEVHYSTWFPEYQILARPEGFERETQVVPDTGWGSKSATIYDDPWDARPWNPSNTRDDHMTPGRQDYSVILGETLISSGQIKPGLKYFVESSDVTTACSIVYNGVTYSNQQSFVGVSGVTTFTISTGSPLVYPPGSYLEFGQNGVLVDQHQDAVEELRIPPSCRGRLVQLRFRCRRGRMIVKGVGPEGTFTSRSKGGRT